MPGLCCCAGFSLVAVSGGYSLAAVCRLLTVASFLLQSRGSRASGLSSRGVRAWLLQGMWDLPRPGVEPMSPASEVESFHLDHQGSLRPVPFRMRACLERAEEREGTARGRSSHPCEPSLGSATWQCALTERQFHSPPVPSRNPETSSLLSPRNALPRVGTATVFTGKLGTN